MTSYTVYTPMLTRHLYREDEVRASLLWCILKRRHVETAFWATELVESGLDPWRTLWSAWMYGIGLAGLGWLDVLLEGGNPVELAVQLSCFQGRDASVVAILGSAGADRVGDPALPPGFSGTPLETYMARAMMQGKAATFWACSAAPTATVAIGAGAATAYPWPLWNQIMLFKHGRTIDLSRLPCEPRLQAALATAIVCQRSLKLGIHPIQIPVEVHNAMVSWGPLCARKRRVFAPPIDCLSHLTARGALDPYTSTEDELMDPPALEAACGFSYRTDAEKEALYEARFPDDIPDEWSAADRAKSHGRGVNACDMRRFLQRWFGSMPCAAIWKGVDRVELEGPSNGFEFYGAPKAGMTPLPSFQPVRRVIDIPQRAHPV